MNSQNLWQVAAEGRLYEADSDEMIQWINEGALLPEDLVKHGQLRWLEAGKVPILQKYFLALAEKNINPPDNLEEVYTNFQVKEVESENRSKPFPRVSSYTFSNGKLTGTKTEETNDLAESDTEDKSCYLHPELEPYYYCGACLNCFCKACPNSYGTVKLCPLCGGLCNLFQKGMDIQSTHGAINKPYKRVRASEAVEEVESGLTIRDLITSLKFPFKFPIGFLVQLLLFITLGIGIGGILISSPVMFVIGIISTALVITLQFGEFSKTLENLTQNDIHSSFMPHLNKYSLVEDFIHPFFMGFSVYFVSFCLFFLLGAASFVLVSFNLSTNLDLTESEMRRKNDELNSIILAKQGASENTAESKTPENNQAKIEEIINESKENQAVSMFGDDYLGDNGELAKLVDSLMRLSIYLQMPLFLSFILGLIYFPIGCAVAGSTRSITKILNPYFGFKSVRKLGFDFIKILSLFLGFSLTSIVIAIGIFIGCFYLSFPTVGILLAIIAGSVAFSYFWLVYSEFLSISVSRKLVADIDTDQIEDEQCLQSFA
jgi:hypothetical protein